MEDSTQYVFGSSAEDGWANEGFTITNDTLAEWALVKIKAAREDANRYAMVCKNMINEYEQKMAARLDKMKTETGHLESLLEQYSLTVAMKATKTQATYTLPSGKLKRKFGTVEFKRDDAALAKWILGNDYPDLVETVYKPKWAEVKKFVTVQNGRVVDTNTGAVVDGVTAEDRPDRFEIEVE